MKTMSLNGAWSLTIPGTDFGLVPAQVPGSVYHDLLSAGRIPDPFFRDNENEALKLMEHDFLYARGFTADAALLACEAVLLRCEGLDTLAEISLNGAAVGRADNMHRIWEYDVKALLREGENRIEIRFSSPTKYIREAYAENPADGSSDAMVGFPLLRKAHCMFGWDWGPRLPDAGIWRDISLIGVDTARIRDVLVLQEHEEGRVTLRVQTHVTRFSADVTAVRVAVTGPDGRVFTGAGEDCEIVIDAPQLWWPAGFGEQPLYTVSVELSAGGAALDGWSRRIGLRTMTVSRRGDDWGESFSHCVNGVDVFAMGADYIPEDNLLPRMNPARTRALLEDARAANMNCIRVWGGGFYPDDWFYDICDELGLLVWQDFMFACAVYNLTDAFEENICAEFRDNIRRLRHHASLALWCGNNEMEQFVAVGQWVGSKRQVADYIKMYEYLLPKVLKTEDPQAFYWPASPSSGGSFDAPQDPDRGDVHYWDVWHGLKPFTDYRNYLFRYVSEFGFHGKAPAQRLGQRPHRRVSLTDVSLSARSGPAGLRLAAAAGPGHAVRRGALAAAPRPLHGRGDLAAQRLLAGGQLGEHRLLRPLEGAALLRQTLLRPGADLLPRGGRALPGHERQRRALRAEKERAAERQQRDAAGLSRHGGMEPPPERRLRDRGGGLPGLRPCPERLLAPRAGFLRSGYLRLLFCLCSVR